MMTEVEKLKRHLYEGGSSVGNIKFYPGSSRDSTAEDMARQFNKFLAAVEVDRTEPIDLESELDD